MIGLPDFQKPYTVPVFCFGLKQPFGDSRAAMGGVDGEVENLAFAGGGFASDEEGNGVSDALGDQAVVFEIVGGIPLGGLERGGLDCGDGREIGLGGGTDFYKTQRVSMLRISPAVPCLGSALVSWMMRTPMGCFGTPQVKVF